MEASRNQGNGGRVRSSMDGGGGGAGAGAGSEVTRERATQGAGTSVNPTRAAAARPPQADQGEGPCFFPRFVAILCSGADV
jgi:hypothetical protein